MTANELKEAEKALKKTREAYKETSDTSKSYQDDIETYEKASAEAIKGNSSEVIKILGSKSEKFLTVADTAQESADKQKEIHEQQVYDAATNLALLNDKYADSMDVRAKAEIKSAEESFERAKKEFEKVGGNISIAISTGAEKEGTTVYDKMASIAQRAVEAAKRAFKIESPSKIIRDQVGKMVSKGLAVGIEEETPKVCKSIEEQADKILDSYKELTVEQKFKMKYNDVPKNFFATKNNVFGSLNDGINQKLSQITLDAKNIIFGKSFNGMVPADNANASNIVSTTNSPVLNFYQPVESPDVVTRQVNKVLSYGSAGAR